jgi:protein-disulfide isomerase
VNKRTWIIFGVICVAIFGTLIAISRGQTVNVDKVDETKILSASADSGNIPDHVFGKADSKVVLIEYGDFQCPACGQAFPILLALSQQNKDRIAFVFRNFPLTTIHPNAKAAAAAAEAASLQGKYWEMHDKLYETQNDWNTLDINARTDAFIGYARAIGIKNIDTFKTDMAGDAVSKKISFNLALGKKLNVDATPTIYLNGKKVESDTWGNKAKFQAAIDDALKQ